MITGKLCGKVALMMMPIAAAVVLIATSNPLIVRIQDQCDPATFNAAFGDGTCSGDGHITVEHFLAEVARAQKAGAWHFDPADGTLASGTQVKLTNFGGETHTFTKVANFGGGFIVGLNVLSGNPAPAAECISGTVPDANGILPAAPPSDSNIFVEAGETESGPVAGDAVLPNGTINKFQCCIHPWMRTELRTK
jgi:plastocyanin